MPRSARMSTSALGRSPATMMESPSTRRRSTTVPSSGPTRAWWRRSPSARAPTSARARRSRRTSRRERSRWDAPPRSSRTAGPPGRPRSAKSTEASHVRNRRIRRRQERGRHHRRRAEATRVSGLRLRGRRGAPPRHAPCAARRRPDQDARGGPRRTAADRRARHRPHALGDPWPAVRGERPPPTDCDGTLVVVHNGIIENYLEIKERLLAAGHQFRSETDTEVIAHLIEHHLRATGRLDRAVKAALSEVTGSYAVGVISTAAPDRLVAAKQGAGSVVVGLGQGEMFVASDIPAILRTRAM